VKPAKPPIRGTVIVLNWQGEAWLEECLRTLLDQTAREYRVLVVDNGSRDASAEIAATFDVDWMPLSHNRGFSAANNAAARVATGDWLIFVNNDMRFERNFVTSVSQRLYADNITFAVDVAQRDWDGRRSHGAVKVRAGSGSFGFTESFPDVETRVPFGNGGALGVRRDLFDALGGWDERMFAGSEDVDLCWRAWLRGWSTVYLPEVLAHAKIGGASSTEEGRAIRRRAVVKGRLVFAAKHLPARDALREWLAISPRALLRRGPGSAVVEALGALPGVLRERRQLYAGTSPKSHLSAMRLLG
jgi:GT2 family glycosyltransferase